MPVNGNDSFRPSRPTTDVSFYIEDLPSINGSALKILEEYSGISPDEIAPHLHNVGCGFAQDLRQLVIDGAPAENVYGLELEKPFIDLGYELFQDRAKLPAANFVVADMLDPDPDTKAPLLGKIDIVYASQFFHLWGWDSQVQIGKALIKLLNPARKSLIVGYQCGTVAAYESERSPTKEGKTYLHDVASLQKLWDEIGEATGTQWRVEARLDKAEIYANFAEVNGRLRRISFAIDRVG